MTAATWAVPFVCLILAFYIGYYKLKQYNLVVQDKKSIQQEIADVDNKTKAIPSTSIDRLVAPTSQLENYDFLTILQQKIRESGVTFKSWSNATPTPLPPIQNKNATASGNGGPTQAQLAASGGLPPNTNGQNPAQTSGYDLLHLPLGVQAISTDVTISGTYGQIRTCLYLLRNARYLQRAININNISLGQPDNKGRLEAKMTLTRFVQPQPKQAVLPPNAVPPSGAAQVPPAASAANTNTPVPAGH